MWSTSLIVLGHVLAAHVLAYTLTLSRYYYCKFDILGQTASSSLFEVEVEPFSLNLDFMLKKPVFFQCVTKFVTNLTFILRRWITKRQLTV